MCVPLLNYTVVPKTQLTSGSLEEILRNQAIEHLSVEGRKSNAVFV